MFARRTILLLRMLLASLLLAMTASAQQIKNAIPARLEKVARASRP
jgi:hypothetical protein